MVFGYARVSSKDQKLDRQIQELQKADNTIYIYMDKQSGKDFERKEYKKLMRRLKKDDTVIVKSIDRLRKKL